MRFTFVPFIAAFLILLAPKATIAEDLLFSSVDRLPFSFNETGLGAIHLRSIQEISENCARLYLPALRTHGAAPGAETCTLEPAAGILALGNPRFREPLTRTGIMLVWTNPVASPANCTATLLAHDIIVTAGHCVDTERGWATAASFIPDFYSGSLSLNAGYGIDITNPIQMQNQSGWDFAILRLTQPVSGMSNLPLLRFREAIVGETAYIVQHPAGQVKMVSSFNCVVEGGNAFTFAHSCSTFGGTSGSLVWSASDHSVIGMHIRGGLAQNEALTLTAMANSIDALSDLFRRAAPAPSLELSGDPFFLERFTVARLEQELRDGRTTEILRFENSNRLTLDPLEGTAMIEQMYKGGYFSSRADRLAALQALISMGADASRARLLGKPIFCWSGLSPQEREFWERYGGQC